MIISRTPFRVSFFGGGTDFPMYFREHGGSTLSVTLDKACYLSVHESNPLANYAFRVNYSRTEDARNIGEIQHPLVRETLRFMKIKTHLEITHNSDLPGRSGLGTSSAFTVGLMHALHALTQKPCTPEDLARGAIHIERELVGDIGGWQDQYAAAYGGLLRLDYHPDGHVSVKKIPVTADRLLQIEQHTLLFYTGSERQSGELQASQDNRIKENKRLLTEMKHLSDEAEQLLTNTDDLIPFGSLLHETWKRKRELTDGISNKLVDDAYSSARHAGALGGKLLGAGGQGFLLLFCSPADIRRIRGKLSHLTEIPIRFSSAGSQIIFKS